MSNTRKLKIAVVSSSYSEGMGYSENCLPKALAGLGHEVHVLTSTFNIYGNSPDYDKNYRTFLGPAQLNVGSSFVDGYHVHRLDARILFGYIRLKGLSNRIRHLRPDVVHALEIASLETFEMAIHKPFAAYELFCETHQHMSVVRPFLKAKGSLVRKLFYRLTRTLPTSLASLAVTKCYAISPDCAEVATRFYGVREAKVTIHSLGTDTDLFHPAETYDDHSTRKALRQSLDFGDDDIVCVYSGRFSNEKNPLVLAKTVDELAREGRNFKGLFIGDGVQKEEIAGLRACRVVPFMKHRDLAQYYRAADVAVWPTQESMSMLDAASTGLALVVSDRMGEVWRIDGNGRTYEENSLSSLKAVLRDLSVASDLRALGIVGRRKMLASFSWERSALTVLSDYHEALRDSVVPRVDSGRFEVAEGRDS